MTVLLLLTLIFICCLFNNAFAQSHGERGAVAGQPLYNYELYDAVTVIPMNGGILERHIDLYPKSNFAKYPIEKYLIDTTRVKRINIGERIPDNILDLPLWVVHDLYGRDTISLRQCMDRPWIILDAWDENCAPCVASMQKWEGLYADPNVNFTLVGLYASYYYHRAVNAVRTKKWESVQVVGPSMAILSQAFFGAHVLGPSVWIKEGKLFGISQAMRLKDDDYNRLLHGELHAIPDYAVWRSN